MKILAKVFQYFPLTIFTIFGIAFSIVVATTNIQYDDGGMRGLIFLTSQIFTLPIWLAGEVLFALNEGKAIPGQYFVSTSIGLLSALLIDYLIKAVLKRKTIQPSERAHRSL
jgi:hypothetical protein